jgi:hypothetical protein
MNLMKDDSLYSTGMQPFVFSKKKWENTGVGWHRGGTDIVYDSSGGQTIRTCSKTVSITPMILSLPFYVVRPRL